MYPAQIVLPMKAELTDAGFEDITTPEGVVDVIENSKVSRYGASGSKGVVECQQNS